MTAVTRQLLVMRHAKAEPFAASDHDRALSARGTADAAAAGKWASAQGLAPDYVVVSSAARTRGTWERMAAAAGWDVRAVVDKSLYGAGTDCALEILRTVPTEARAVMVVGHNPTMAYLVHLLDDGGADAAVFARLSVDYPTSALTVLDVPGDWADLDVASARVRSFHVGRG